MSPGVILQSMRLPFLALTPVCVLLGAATVDAAARDLLLLAMILGGALLAHIGVNTLNEYEDFRSGLDLHTKRTRFSGGSGALPQHPEVASQVLMTGIAALTGVALLGMYFVWRTGWGIVPFGLAGFVLIISYTGWLNRQPVLCLLAPGFGFGMLMVAGTAMVLSGKTSTLTWCAAGIPFLLSNNLLLLNQYPDIAADTRAGRRHVPIVYGTRVANLLYGLLLMTTLALLLSAIYLGVFPLLSWIALLPMSLGIYALMGAIRFGGHIGEYPHYLAVNVITSLGTPLLLAIALWLPATG